MKCDDCRYGTIVKGECRRNGPIVTASGRARWPKLEPKERGCGEYEPAPAYAVAEQMRKTLDALIEPGVRVSDGARYTNGARVDPPMSAEARKAWQLDNAISGGVPLCTQCLKVRGGQLAAETCECSKESNDGND